MQDNDLGALYTLFFSYIFTTSLWGKSDLWFTDKEAEAPFRVSGGVITQPERGWQGWGLNLTSSNSKSHALSEHTLLRIYLHPPPNLVSKILTTSISKYWLMMYRLEGIRKLVQGKRCLHEDIIASPPEQSFERLSNRGVASRKTTDHFSPQKADCSTYAGSKREQAVTR